ncbi:hypothetical protein E3N88_33999 [Mikania micrantha]|uniref:Retrotransposon gag domain-containing protein n=1 Tax=Mikania micrantha TaxID=192012 RepID=A0A5N6MFH9_9ASTR|nr:hypothetical protein E3N88_33999 [Mikania micrantha]
MSSLKSKLAKNPKDSRSVTEYLQDMRSIADDLALAQSPVTEEDLLVHILSQLGDEFGTIVAAIKVCETPVSYPELFDKLTDFERALKESAINIETAITTVNYTTRHQGHSQPSQLAHNGSFSRPNRSQIPISHASPDPTAFPISSPSSSPFITLTLTTTTSPTTAPSSPSTLPVLPP